MTPSNKIGIVVDEDFATKNSPSYPHPIFLSYENPLRIKSVLSYLEEKKIFQNERVIKLKPKSIEDSILYLAHTKYHVDSIKNLSSRGSCLLGDELYITEDTFELAKKAIGGAIASIESVINQEVNQSLALIRPPGHHALREKSSGFCIFNNIATSIIYLREKLQYKNRIAIIDIDAHFGDGLVQYFYEDPSVLYFSIHEFDFIEGDLGFINELGEGEGLGKSINFPIPLNTTDEAFLEFIDVIEPILKEFNPDIILIAAGFDMYFTDPIGNCLLTSISYYRFAEKLLRIAENACEGKIVFILEGGYSLIGLPLCIYSVILSLLNESYKQPAFENIDFSNYSKKDDMNKIKSALKKLLSNYWNL